MVPSKICKAVGKKRRKGNPPNVSKKFHPPQDVGEGRGCAPTRRRSLRPEVVMFSVDTSTVQGGLVTQVPPAGAFLTG